MHCKHLPARDDWVKQEYLQNAAQGEEVCLHMWLSLWPLTSTWGHSEYKRRETHNLQVPSLDLHSTPRALRFFQTIWPLRRSHGSHWEQFTSIRTYFRKPLIQNRNKAGLLSPPPSPLSSCLLSFVFSSPSWNNLHQQEELQFSFCFVPYLYWSAVKVILHLIITILPRKRLTLGTRKWLWRRGGAVLRFHSHMLKKKKRKKGKQTKKHSAFKWTIVCFTGNFILTHALPFKWDWF